MSAAAMSRRVVIATGSDAATASDVDAIDRSAAALLDLLGRDGESSLARLGKRLALSRSELARLLLVLSEPEGADGAGDGLGLVEQRETGGRTLVALSARGRAQLGIVR
jgi:DNA-binding IclR family transcriptional regulator